LKWTYLITQSPSSTVWCRLSTSY